jgi:hypothetical protein
MYKKNSWIVALLVALSFSIFFIGCIDPLAEGSGDGGTYTKFELTKFNAWGGNAENQQGWGSDGAKWDNGKKTVESIGLTVEMLQKARYLVVEVNDGFPKNNFETIWSSWDESGEPIGNWEQFSNITGSGGDLNPGFGKREGNTLTLEMPKILKNYSVFMDSSTASITLLIQHWGNGGTGACIKSAHLLISEEPVPHENVTGITLVGGAFKWKKEFALNATVAPTFATNQKILWSIRKWVSKDGTKTIDLDADLTSYESFVAKNDLKGKVDFKTTYNDNDDPVYGRSAIIATDGINSAGTVTLLATIKNGLQDPDTEAFSDFTATFTIIISDSVDYVVPAGDITFFYIDLNEWDTPGHSEINANVPLAVTTADDITIPFTENNQRVNFKFSAAQLALLTGLWQADQDIDIYIDGEVTENDTPSGDSWRYHIGLIGRTGSWNASNGSNNVVSDYASLASISDLTLTLGQNKTASDGPAFPEYFILQHRNANAVTIKINSIKVTHPPQAIDYKVDGVEQSTYVYGGHNASVGSIDGGYKVTQPGDSWTNSGLGYFKVKFPDGKKLSDYASLDCDIIILPIEGSDWGHKNPRLYAFADVPASFYSGVQQQLGTSETATSELDETAAIKNHSMAISSVNAGVDLNEVYIVINMWNSGDGTTYEITNINFVPKP